MTCKHVGSGCNAPEGECSGLCLSTTYSVGTRLTDRETREEFTATSSDIALTDYVHADGRVGMVITDQLESVFAVEVPNGR